METKILKSKVCLVGDLAVGKTSLIRRFVLNLFDDSYQITLGTKVSKKTIQVPLSEKDVLAQVDIMLWDMMGHVGLRELLEDAYFHGARGILAVADLTRRSTLIDLAGWIESVEGVAGKVPVVIAVNKADLPGEAEFGAREIDSVAEAYGSAYFMTSAKTGEHVEDLFQHLGKVVALHQLGATEES